MCPDLTSGTAWLSAEQLRAAYGRRELSPVEVVQAVLDRIERLDPEHAIFVTRTPELALEAARRAEVSYREGEPGLLAGVPVSIKDLVEVEGVRTTYGSLAYGVEQSPGDAPVTARLREAGAAILGKTATPEMGWKGETTSRVHGSTHNPWRHGLTAGGSSGGAAAAVALGMGPLAQGGDGAGSIRIPSSFCGVFGIKPTAGLIPQANPSGSGLSAIGPISRTVGDAALFLDAAAGLHTHDTLDAGVEGVRVAWAGDLGYAAVEPEILELCRAAAFRLDAAEAALTEAHPGLDDPWPLVDTIWAHAQAADHREDFDEVRDRLDPGRAEVIERGLALPPGAAEAAQDGKAAYARAWDSFMAGHDLVMTPTLPLTAFAAGLDHPGSVAGRPVEYLSWTAFTYPFNVAGYPAASVPCGRAADGMPVGLQIAGRRGEEALVLRAARSFERLAPWDYEGLDR